MNFKNIVEQVSTNVKYEPKPIDISTWAQYRVKDGKIHHLTELSDNKETNSNETMYKISVAIQHNMNRYQKKYDEIHGEGAYDRLYYLEPIYPDLDDELEEEEENYEPEENYSYEQNVHCY